MRTSFSLCAMSVTTALRPAIRVTRTRALSMRTTFSASDFPSSWPYSEVDFSRMDESADFNFYSAPRFVTHIDDMAIAALTQFYERTLPAGADLCDVCSSWISHLPNDLKFGRVTGVGMNARELEANGQLTEWVQADLNIDPKLPFDDESFDYVLCVVSIDYLVRPREVISEFHRVLRPGGRVLLSFSNRCFPTVCGRAKHRALHYSRQLCPSNPVVSTESRTALAVARRWGSSTVRRVLLCVRTR